LLIAVLIAARGGRGGLAVSAAPSPAAALLLDGLVGLVDLFHLLLGQVGQRIVHVVVGVILAGQLPVCLLDLLVAGVGLDAQNAVGISHVLCLHIFCF